MGIMDHHNKDLIVESAQISFGKWNCFLKGSQSNKMCICNRKLQCLQGSKRIVVKFKVLGFFFFCKTIQSIIIHQAVNYKEHAMQVYL